MNWNFSKLILLTALLPGIHQLQAQETEMRSIKGRVQEVGEKNKKQPLIGVTVETIDHTAGTTTDEDGRYKLEVPVTADRIVLSYIGYQADTVQLKDGDNSYDVVLSKPKELQEVEISVRQKSTQIGLLDPMKTEKIGAREFLKAACCNLSESFETTPSVDVAFTDAVSGYKQIQMLGLSGPYTLITRENIPDTRGLGSVTGLTYTPGPWIEGMQLSKGTGSVVNGYESVAGQINVELKKPFEEKDERVHINLYQSTQGRTEGNIVARHEFSESLSSNIFLSGRSNWMKVDMNNDGFLDQPLDDQYMVANRWFWFAPNGWEIQGGVKGVYSDNTGGQWDYKAGTEQVAGNPWGYEMQTQRADGWMKIGKMFPNKPGTSIGLQLGGVYHDQDALYGRRNYNAIQRSLYSNLIFQTILGNTNHVLKTGLSNLIDNYDEKVEANRYMRNEVVPGAFAEYSYNYLTKFNVVAGVRGDHHNLFGAFVTPRLHLRYAPHELTAIRASIGRAQRTANIFAENLGNMASIRALYVVNPEAGKPYGLDPEVAWNTGLNVTQKFRLDYRDGAFSADYYYTNFQNQVVVDLEDAHAVRFYNLRGESFAHSLQGQLDYELIHRLDLRLAYRWYDVQTTYSGELKMRPLVAAHRAFANVGYETKNKWSFDYTIQWIGQKRVPSIHDHNTGGTTTDSYSPSFIQMNAQISKSWKDIFELYVGGENLTNYMQHHPIIGASTPFATGFDASMIWGPVMGRNIYAGLRYKIK